LRGVAYRELFAFEPAKGEAGARAAATAARRCAGDGVRAGLAPHAPYTVCAEALGATGATRLPVSVHLAETPEEREWCFFGRGPIESLLEERGRRPVLPIPRGSPVDVLERAGLLRPRTLVVHANALTRDEIGRLVRAGCVAVHCPGTHAYFRRGAPPVRRWIEAGLPFALGTDSLASNDDPRVLGEMARLRRSDPACPARAIVDAATRGGAEALGLPDAGRLSPGSRADLVSLAFEPPRRDSDFLEALVHDPPIAAFATA
jgi:cytosine/adenosine deaminase-related metal-dependent hydrolase